MGTLSPQRKAVLFTGHLTGRLGPMALDNLLLSVSAAGFTQAQIDQVPSRLIANAIQSWTSWIVSRVRGRQRG